MVMLMVELKSVQQYNPIISTQTCQSANSLKVCKEVLKVAKIIYHKSKGSKNQILENKQTQVVFWEQPNPFCGIYNFIPGFCLLF